MWCEWVRHTITEYDQLFFSFPLAITPALANLRQTATYDLRMGTLTSVTDANGQVTGAEYDGFGRMNKLIKPGDSSGVPTVLYKYQDWARPFRFEIFHYEAAGNPNLWRPTIKYYDGLGREIQAKVEHIDLAEHIVTATVYDGLGQAIKRSQPRYVNQSTTFWDYAPLAADSTARWTTTAYDAPGRPTRVTPPDGNYAETAYKVEAGLLVAVSTDAKKHQVKRGGDMFGRLRRVEELRGTGTAADAWAVDATTQYEYTPLDLLWRVTDAYGKQTTMSYDSLGRKLSMGDVTMGNWSYSYDAAGNLKTQTDARGVTISFSYDALNRLTSKTYSTGGYSLYYYDESRSTNARGRLSYADRYNAAGGLLVREQNDYNARGQRTRAMHFQGALGSWRIYGYEYDSGERLRALSYPSGEKVSYGYDAAWRQKTLCTDLAGSGAANNCYVGSVSYTALDQPQGIALGNGLSESYGYNNVMSRLSSIAVGAGGAIMSRGYSYDAVGNGGTTSNYQSGLSHSYG